MSLEQLREQIRETPISMIIGHFIPLTKKGANLEALCPFHADSNPSLKVNDSKGMYKCFVCDEGGDAINFVKEYRHVDFVEALKIIAGILGLPFEEIQKDKKKNPRVEMALRVLNASVRLYKKFSSQNPKYFQDFVETRKLNQISLETFQISYAPANNALINYLQTIPAPDRDFALKTAQEIGIIKYNEERKSQYDFYRDRIMFPIHDHSGQVRGFSSRRVREDQIPKYLNSGESFIFNKASILFGLHFAKSYIRQADQVIIVEGNMDVIMMHQFGFQQTVGTMGTALSDSSIKLLSNMTKNIFLAMDSDTAGKKAMARINADFMSTGLMPKVINFEPAKDPDEYLLKEGRLSLLERIEKAPLLVDVLIAELIPPKPSENTEVKLSILNQIFEVVSPLKENLSATEKILQAAKTLGLKSDSATILNYYKEFLSKHKERPAPQITKTSIQETVEKIISEENQPLSLPTIEPDFISGPIGMSEKVFIREIICHPEFLTHLDSDEFLAIIRHDEVKKLFRWLVTIYSEIDDSEYVTIVQDELQYGSFGKELINIGTEALFNHGNKYNEKVILRMLKDYKLMLKMEELRSKRKDLVLKQKSAPSQLEIDTILSEISKIDKEIHQLKNSAPSI
jgi:DNA primase